MRTVTYNLPLTLQFKFAVHFLNLFSKCFILGLLVHVMPIGQQSQLNLLYSATKILVK